MTQTIAYLDCHSGISGDMFLGALLDAGLSFEKLQQQLSQIPIAGYHMELTPFADKGIHGSRFHVVLEEQEQPTRHLSDIVSLIERSQLAPPVQQTALAIFQRLAEAEARVHNSSVEAVHFHEVGAIDAIVDITGAAIGIEELGITQLYSSPLPLTNGHVQTAHGLLPVPAPATLELLSRVRAPWQMRSVEGELVTPTGAAILATLASFEAPTIAIEKIGYGFGQKRLPWPNCLRFCLGTQQMLAGEMETDWVMVIESHIDNMSGELLGSLMDRLLAAGALDVSYTPLQMKKNRPATMVTVISTPEQSNDLALVLLRETTTLGVRLQQMQRLKAERFQQQIETPLGPVRVKVKRLGERVISALPEYDDCLRIAEERAMPLSEVYEVARQSAQLVIIGAEKR